MLILCPATATTTTTTNQCFQVLEGARSMDRHFATAPLASNLPVLMGLLGVWNLSFLKYTARTMLPYSEAMCKFPAHVQQVKAAG